MKVTLLLAGALTMMAGAVISPALPSIKDHFAGQANADLLVRLVITLPSLTIAVTAPLVGMFADRWGRKPVLLAALVLYGVAGASGFVVDSLAGILVGRAFLGLAVAGIMTSVTALIADYYTGAARAGFMGLASSFVGFGGVAIVLGGGLLADVGWRTPFLVYLVALALVPLVLRVLFDARGVHAGTSAPADDTDGVVPVRLVALIYLIAMVSQIAFYLLPTQLPFHLEDLGEAGSSRAGLALATSTGFMALSALWSRRLLGRVVRRSADPGGTTGGYLQVFGLAFAVMGIGYAGIAAAETYPWVLAALAIAGIGVGLVFPTLNTWLTSAIPARVRGRAVGGLSSAIFFGHFLSPVISQPVSDGIGLAATYGVAGAALAVVAVGLGTIGFRPVEPLRSQRQS